MDTMSRTSAHSESLIIPTVPDGGLKIKVRFTLKSGPSTRAQEGAHTIVARKEERMVSGEDYVTRTTADIVHNAFLIIETAQRYKYHHEFSQLVLIGKYLYAIIQNLVGLRRRNAQT
jgi:hypothetical protein